MKLEMDQKEFANLLGLSGAVAVSNIETGVRNSSKLTGIILGVLDSLPKRKAEDLIKLMLTQGKKST